ncbi:MAG: DNA topoisomerase IB [Allosphingosinicella sp.]|uniref:DNA topoisomerase IB n=1 Tax=Allosphingosinicella sp. TaxID=2823234 RepID=UPI00394AA76B
MLCYVDDTLPGITRRRRGRYWQYFDAEGDRITDRDEIDRLNAIGLPPAYSDAWYCPSPHGHIQAIGYDDKGRKQYRYHPEFRAQQEAVKYDLCAEFGKALPKLRKRVEADLSKRTLSRETVCAAVVRLLDCEHIRVGNEAYARENKSFGATTIRRRHVKAFGRRVKMRFPGKHGIVRELNVTDRNLTRIVKKAQDLPGQHLFKYVDDEGEPVPVSSGDVNAYIKAAMGADFTAKHFRTWGASAIAFEQLCKAGGKGITLKQMVEPVAEALGNTPAISRKSYIHPALIEALKNDPRDPLGGLQCPRKSKYLSSAERGLILFLENLSDAGAEMEREAA